MTERKKLTEASNSRHININNSSHSHPSKSQSRPMIAVVALLLTAVLAIMLYYSMDNQLLIGNTNVNANVNANVNVNKNTASKKTPIVAIATTNTDNANDSNSNNKSNNKSNYQHKYNYQPFNTTNPHQDSWCPYANCQNSPLCTPCNRRYILILATGRSGSTTVLKMINYLPTVRLSGENRNFIGVASTLISNFQLTDGNNLNSEKGKSVSPLLSQNFDREEGAYVHNAIPPQAMSCPIQQALNVLNPPPKLVQQNDHLLSIQEYDKDTIMGCKTIRFHKNNFTVKQASEYLKEVFPCSKIIVNIRSNVEGQLESIQGTFTKATPNGKTTDDITKYNQWLIDVATYLGNDMAKVIDLSKWKDNVDVFNDVAHWLGFRNCKFTSIVHENLNGYGRDNETDVGIDENCHYPY